MEKNVFLKWINKAWIKFPLIFFGVILIFFITMIGSYALPNQRIEKNAGQGIDSIVDPYPNPLNMDSLGGKLDLYTDKIMLQTSIIPADTTFDVTQLAMNNNDYARYWHGYQVILRPLLEIFSYAQIKYLLMFVIFILFAFTVVVLKQKLNTAIAFLFAVVSIASFIILIPACMQFASVFVIMMSLIIAICKCYKPGEKSYLKWCYAFLIVGMITNFLDLLTAPIITLGVPLVVLLLINLKYHENNLIKRNILTTILCSATWVIGYALTWLSKWVLASLVLKRNVITQSIEQIFFRIGGNSEYPLNRSYMFRINFRAYFGSLGSKSYVVLGIILIGFILLYIFFRKPIKNVIAVIPFLIIAVYPIVWMLVLSNHSQIHAFFVNRILMIMPFAFFSALIYLIDWDKLKHKFKRNELNLDTKSK